MTVRLVNKESEDWFVSKVLDGTLSVSEDGLVFNNKTKRLIGATGSGRYPKISMMYGRTDSGKKIIRHIQIHRLVWRVYRGEIPFGIEINHIDEDRENCSVHNLELTTPKENSNKFFDNHPEMKPHNKFTKEQLSEFASRRWK